MSTNAPGLVYDLEHCAGPGSIKARALLGPSFGFRNLYDIRSTRLVPFSSTPFFCCIGSRPTLRVERSYSGLQQVCTSAQPRAVPYLGIAVWEHERRSPRCPFSVLGPRHKRLFCALGFPWFWVTLSPAFSTPSPSLRYTMPKNLALPAPLSMLFWLRPRHILGLDFGVLRRAYHSTPHVLTHQVQFFVIAILSLYTYYLLYLLKGRGRCL
jgi:hypothetical protein